MTRRMSRRRCPGRYPDGPGRIPAGVIVEVRERTAEEREAEREAAEAEAERGAERAAIEAEGQTDEERLAKLPLSSKLTGRCLRMYHQDARSYWLLQPEVRRFRHNVVQVLNQIEGRKLVWSRPYEYVLTMPSARSRPKSGGCARPAIWAAVAARARCPSTASAASATGTDTRCGK